MRPSILCTILLSFSLFSCQKNIDATKKQNFSSTSAGTDALTGVITLTLQPGPSDGQDAFIQALIPTKTGQDTLDQNINWNYIPKIPAASSFARVRGAGIFVAIYRSYIRFDSLIKIPSTAKILSAQLTLHAPVNYTFLFPLGNSCYPGSTNPPNFCFIQRVTGGTWDQNTITFATAPSSISNGQDTLPTSTSDYYYNPTVDVTNLVKKMVAQPEKNYGFCIKMNTEQPVRNVEFASSEVWEVESRPMLIVQYK